ncbi:MAG TPA: AMP-binding protein [Solirubrobacteraceae bacterium]|nr:AMP-binding protein [Solirubrobacteraceae bacterium]
MNFVSDVVDRLPPDGLALVELARDGSRREWSFGEIQSRSAALAGTLTRLGVKKGDVVMTVIGNRPEWVLTMVACFRVGAVVLPCTEQLRAKDLRLRLEAANPTLVLADERDIAELNVAAPHCRVLSVPDESLFAAEPAPPLALTPEDPCLITFTSGTAGEPKGVVHGQRYLLGQAVQATHWLDAKAGDVVWCTAASGWSKSARNVFIAPWLRGATALLHDARFDPHERLELLAKERVNVLCMAPTEYRVIAKRAGASLGSLMTEAGAAVSRPTHLSPPLRGLVAAGEALNPEILHIWEQATGLSIRDGYGQTETGQLTGAPLNEPIRPGSMGRALPGMKLAIEHGELVVEPSSVPTFFLGYLGEGAKRAEDGGWRIADRAESEMWRTGDVVSEDEEGFLRFEGRNDDVIVSAGYRIGPFEVESALVSHTAVAEAAAVSAEDEERGAVVKAVVVLRDGQTPSPELVAELQEHCKRETAPYKYPRVVEFVEELPQTASGKVRRALLRETLLRERELKSDDGVDLDKRPLG